MFCDRYVEALNLLQDQRRGKFAAFESSIELSPAVVGLMHAVHRSAWLVQKTSVCVIRPASGDASKLKSDY